MMLETPVIEEAPARSSRVVEALESTRRSMRRFQLALAVAGAILAMVAIAAVVAVLDVSWLLPTWVRAVGLGILALTGVGMVARAFFSVGRHSGRDEAASEVESTFPELGQRVRTTLEYSDPTPDTAPARASLIGALIADTEDRSKGLEFAEIVPWTRFTKRALAVLTSVVAVAVVLIYDPTMRIAARRVFLFPAYYTTLTVDPGDRTLKEGTELTLRATFSGRPVASAQWLSRPVGSLKAWESTPLGPSDSSRPILGTIEAVRKDCRADFEYRVVAGEIESDVYRVTVTHPLNLKSFEAAIEPPAYTRLKPSVAKESSFSVPEGSKVRFQITLDRPPVAARLSWTSEGSKTPQTTPLAIEGSKLTAELPPLDKDVRYEVVASAADGMKFDSARYLIKVRPDEKPSIRFLKPSESYSATPSTEVPLKVAASDDYGVAKVGMVYHVGDGPDETLYLDDPKDQPLSMEAMATLYLEKHPLTYSDSVTYRAFVEDNRSPSPHRVSTEFRFIDVVPYKQDFQFSDGGSGGASSKTSVTLEELIERQRRALNRAFAHTDDRPVEEKVADRLSKEEAELAFITGEFADKLKTEFGPISPLEEAAQAMSKATVSLASKELESAIPLEESSLTALIKARQNLRKLLSTKSSSGLCRSIDRSLQQKLRKPPSADKSKEAELAKLEQDVQKLAQNQKAFAEEIDPKSNGGAQLDKKDEAKSGSGSKPSPSEHQEAASKEAQRLEALARSDLALTDLARNRMSEAAKDVTQAETSIKAERPQDAAASARSAAEQLERLAEHVAALKAKELPGRLAKTRDLARKTAEGERELAGKASSAEPGDALARQQGLMESAKTLADVLNQLKSDASEEDRTLGQAVRKAAEANSPVEIEQAMRQASAALGSGDGEKAAESLGQAATKLDGLARDLEAARRDFMQPKLQQLLATERKAADVQKALESASSEAKKAEAEKALSELAKAGESLKPGEGPLRQATEALSQAALGGTTGWAPPPKKIGDRAGLFTPPISQTNAVREFSKALQAKIQELILNDALVDRDGAVPPGYKDKVDDYFRVLSEDLR
jgi:Domain of unknown function (DUF4175)